jgi:hypothetical protein
MITREHAETFIGKYVQIEWEMNDAERASLALFYNGQPPKRGSLVGILVSLERDEDGTEWAVTDDGMGANLAGVVTICESAPETPA